MIARRRRTRILAQSRPSVAAELAELVEHDIEVVMVVPPHQGLVMCQVRETARNSRFYVGEALMSECRVRVDGIEGLGAVLGEDGKLARDMAVIDAILSSPEPPTVVVELERRLLEAESALRQATEQQDEQVLTSRVSFDTMGGQDTSVQAVVR